MKKVQIGALIGALLGVPHIATAQGQNAQATPPEVPQFTTEVVVTPERVETPLNLVSASTLLSVREQGRQMERRLEQAKRHCLSLTLHSSRQVW